MTDRIWIALIFLRLRPVRVWRGLSLDRAERIFGVRQQWGAGPLGRDAVLVVGGGRRRWWPQVALVHSRRPCRRSDQTILRMIRRQLAD